MLYTVSRTTEATRIRILDAALDALERGDVQSLTMAGVAKIAGLSRQAVYLHFENRAGLLIAVVRHADNRHGHGELARPMDEAGSAPELLQRFAKFLAEYNPRIHKVARAAYELRSSDPAIEAAWKDRAAARRAGGRRIAEFVSNAGELAEEWTVPAAGDWITSVAQPRHWEELVVDLGWSKKRFIEVTTRVLCRSLLR